ncbi:MAG: hypothetical protein Q6363_007965 [Candidatus Njordarchaeota archaeon]
MNEVIKIKNLFKQFANLDVDVLETDSAYLINTSPHELKFDDGSILLGNVELAKILKAAPKEKVIKTVNTVTIVKTEFVPEEQGIELVQKIRELNKELSKPVLLISSIISVQAYGYPVVSPITTPETSRLPPAQRVVFKNKFNSVL